MLHVAKRSELAQLPALHKIQRFGKENEKMENEMQKCIYIPTHFSKTVLFCQPHQQLFTHSNTYSRFINKNSLLVIQTWQNETEKRKKDNNSQ